jgi:hypothetical protein
MPRLILALLLALLAIATAIAALFLLFKLCQLLFRIVGGTARLFGWCLAGLWQAAFPKPLPKPILNPSPQSRKFLELSRRLDRLVSTADTNPPSAALPAPEPQPKRTLPQPSKPGEHFLWVQDILVSIREEDGRFIFETTPASRWNEAISWLQDEGLFDKIVNKTFRWADHQPPTK